MAKRFSTGEKGKSHLAEDQETRIKRIKAPYVDNSALIKENALTLIGRDTNPREQRIWALLSDLRLKWHIQGKATGSDLGNGCFQFRFEREEDLQRILDNRPYQFDYWMVIIQRWEPIISASFPSQIPFWIRIKGLPLHFWLEDMICKIGNDLGTLLNHELTKTTTRVKVLVDGLMPLTKEAIIEFDSGEESLIYLEYEKLENHCSACYSLTHLKKDCTAYTRRDQDGALKQKEQILAQREGSYYAEETTFRRNRQLTLNQKYREDVPLTSRDARTETRGNQQIGAFHERVDRYGNSFGARVATKQTKVPPPTRIIEKPNEDSHNWRSKALERVPEPQVYNSPPYTQKRDLEKERFLQRKNPFPQKGLSEWRKKPTPLPLVLKPIDASASGQPQDPSYKITENQSLQGSPRRQVEEQIIKDLNEATLLYLSCPYPTEAAARRQRVLAEDARGQTEETAAGILRIRESSREHRVDTSQNSNVQVPLSKEQVLQDLQEVTKQYLSCVDPVEAAARRQRVLAGDAEDLMERTAESILAASADQRRPLSPWERGVRSESPPGIDFDLVMQPSGVEVTPPPVTRRGEPNDIGGLGLMTQTNNTTEEIQAGKLKSVIVSPNGLLEEGNGESRETLEVA